jgi:lipoprotein NlpD
MFCCRLFPGSFTWAVWVSIMLLLGACASDPKPPPSSPPKPVKVKIQAQYYVVKKGDTLSAIGSKTGHHYLQLAAWNHIDPPYMIYPGQEIRLFWADFSSQPERSRKPVKKASTKRKKTISRKKTSTVSTNKKKRSPLFVEEKAKKELKVSWLWPLKGVITRNYSQTGGKGIDIFGKLGQPVRAAAAGKVVYSGQGLAGYGNLVIVKHNKKFLSAYANNRRLLVKEGDHVRKGQTIAEVGAAAGKKPSLYFEIRKFGKPVNPDSYLPKR